MCTSLKMRGKCARHSQVWKLKCKKSNWRKLAGGRECNYFIGKHWPCEISSSLSAQRIEKRSVTSCDFFLHDAGCEKKKAGRTYLLWRALLNVYRTLRFVYGKYCRDNIRDSKWDTTETRLLVNFLSKHSDEYKYKLFQIFNLSSSLY